MPGRASQIEQVAAISRVTAQVGQNSDVFRSHLSAILGSPAFRGSRRSQEFLQHIVDKALSGHFEDLKERTLGVELFGRPVTYDTSGDAIVRVTASDVRRRLLHFYSEFCVGSETRIELPSGSYIPEFRQIPEEPVAHSEAEIVVAPPLPAETPEVAAPSASSRQPWRSFALVAGALIFLALIAIAVYRSLALRPETNVQPWSALLRRDRQTRVVLCDPDISRLQGVLDFRISLSDYANHRYLPASVSPGTELQRFIQTLRGTDVAAVDVSMALAISELAFRQSHQIRLHTARTLQLGDFKVDDDFILFGSPRSNPWFGLFDDQLDLKFEYDPALRQEVIRNVKAGRGEADVYVPTAQGWETGFAYAVIGFIRNPGQNGHVLILAGSNAEATEAAGKFITNAGVVSDVLRKHGINPDASPEPFEILLRASIMAGSSNTFEVVAFHKLSRHN